MKKLLLILLTLMFSVTLIGCSFGSGDSDEDVSGDITEEDLKGIITIWWPGGSTKTEEAIQTAKTKYEALHPGVTINIVFQSNADFYYAYNMALVGKSFPDVAYIDHVFVQRLAYDGLTVNLSNLNFDQYKDTYIDTLWEPNLYKGDLYGLPMSVNSIVTVYNKALLSRVYGREFTEDDYPKNWEEFMAIGAKIEKYNTDNSLTGNDKLYLTTIPTGSGNESMGAMYFMAMSKRAGGTVMNADLTEMTLNTEQNIFAATKIKELGDNGYTTTTFSESKFEQGNVAFIEMGPWKQTDYSRIAEADDTIEYCYHSNIPYETGGNTDSTIGLYSLVITKKTANAKLAADFALFLSTDEEIQLMHAKPYDLMPVTKASIANEYYTQGNWPVFVEQLNHIVTRCGSAAWPSIEKNLSEYITGLVNKTRDVSYLTSLQIALSSKLEDLEEDDED